ncbi:MAG TPA: FAD-dependent oxidoreductase, partial [Firmicutes bacterium]|nr:FAD-dependent oxidoreductase [Bacillota bacterium]
MGKKVYVEAANTLPVYDECDIPVVGGGSAGHSAAIAAARAGARNIIIMERYGYMGGDVTGGYVIMVPKLSWYNKSFVRGLQEEWFTRLEKIPEAVLGPRLDQIGDTDPAMLNAWRAIHGCVSESKPHRLVRAVYFDPQQLKIEMDKMLLEEKDSIRVLYHSWGTKPIMEGNEVKGVIFESKEGRQAILAKVVIDATGDGDIFRQTGTPYKALADSNTRSNTTALVWRIGGINWDLYYEWRKANPDAGAALYKGLAKVAGYRCAPIPSNRNDICWI